MVSHLEKVGFEKGAEEIRLTVYSNNKSACELYNSLGFSSKIITFSKTIVTDLN